MPQQASITLLDARARALAGEDTLLYRYAPLAAHALAPRAALTSGGGVLTVAGAGFAPAELGAGFASAVAVRWLGTWTGALA